MLAHVHLQKHFKFLLQVAIGDEHSEGSDLESGALQVIFAAELNDQGSPLLARLITGVLQSFELVSSPLAAAFRSRILQKCRTSRQGGQGQIAKNLCARLLFCHPYGFSLSTVLIAAKETVAGRIRFHPDYLPVARQLLSLTEKELSELTDETMEPFKKKDSKSSARGSF